MIKVSSSSAVPFTVLGLLCFMLTSACASQGAGSQNDTQTTPGATHGASAAPSSLWYSADSAPGLGAGSPCALLPSPAVGAVFGPLTDSDLVQQDVTVGNVAYSTGIDVNGDPYCHVEFMPAHRPAADAGNDPPVIEIGMSQTNDIAAFLSENGWHLSPVAGANGELGGHSSPLTGLEAIVPVTGGFVYANDPGPECTASACPDGITLTGLDQAAAVEARQIARYPVSGGLKGVSSIP